MRDIGKINTKLDELRSKLDAKINAKLSELTNPYVTPTVTQRDRLIAALRVALRGLEVRAQMIENLTVGKYERQFESDIAEKLGVKDG